MPDEQSAPFWKAASDHVLTVAKCSKCDQATLPPDLTCPHCHSTAPDFRFVPVEGGARIRTWAVIRRSFLSGFKVPFVLVDAELDAYPDLRLIGQLLDGADAKLSIGAPVVVEFEDLAPGISVPAFRLKVAA
ncbi:MAG: OB-fold domain-containing protein [Novosphingobium sp.]|nr:OB-fold domain-containing protein [Novosphingobium sp.]